MKIQKGQSLVEFALVVPFFLLLIFGLIYSGMLFHDYSSLSNAARSAAREAALIEGHNQTDYDDIRNFYSRKGSITLTSLYKTQSFTITKGINDDNPNEVYVKLTMRRTPDSSFIMNMVLPQTFDIVYFMKKETTATSPPSETSSGSDG